MNTPASSVSSADSGSTPPGTPKREYTYHKTVKNTYGRAKISTPSSFSSSLDTPSSPDPWASYSISLSANNSPTRTRTPSRLSGSFDRITAPPSLDSSCSNTPSRGTRTLTEKLARAKLDFESGTDSDDDDDRETRKNFEKTREEDENVFLVRGSGSSSRKQHHQDSSEERQQDDATDQVNGASNSPQTTPSKRKRNFVEAVASTNAITIRKSSRRTSALHEPAVGLEEEQDRDRNDSFRLGRITPRSSSPTPPASPSQRSSKRSRLSLPAVVSSSLPTIATGLRAPTKQATLSAFFTTNAGKGTGILKSKPNPSTATSNSTISKTASIPGVLNSIHSANTQKSSSAAAQEPSKKLEQLFLDFPKNRKASGLSNTGASSASPSKSLIRPPAKLQREENTAKRYHCPQCGMPYVRGQPDDEKTHDWYHRAVLGGIDYPGYKNEVVVAQFKYDANMKDSAGASDLNLTGTTSRIVMVSMTDSGKASSPVEKRKVKEVLQVVNKELGSVDFDPEQLDSCKVFLYISGKKKVVGCVVAERIKQGFEIISSLGESTPTSATFDMSPASSLSSSTNSSSSTSMSTSDISNTKTSTAIKNDTTSEHHHLGSHHNTTGSAIFCSTDPLPAICGINRIWVSAQHRRQRIASRLLDAVRDRFIYACKLQRRDVAFSQPTGDGKALARQYLATDKFLVYVE